MRSDVGFILTLFLHTEKLVSVIYLLTYVCIHAIDKKLLIGVCNNEMCDNDTNIVM